MKNEKENNGIKYRQKRVDFQFYYYTQIWTSSSLCSGSSREGMPVCRRNKRHTVVWGTTFVLVAKWLQGQDAEMGLVESRKTTRPTTRSCTQSYSIKERGVRPTPYGAFGNGSPMAALQTDECTAVHQVCEPGQSFASQFQSRFEARVFDYIYVYIRNCEAIYNVSAVSGRKICLVRRTNLWISCPDYRPEAKRWNEWDGKYFMDDSIRWWLEDMLLLLFHEKNNKLLVAMGRLNGSTWFELENNFFAGDLRYSVGINVLLGAEVLDMEAAIYPTATTCTGHALCALLAQQEILLQAISIVNHRKLLLSPRAPRLVSLPLLRDASELVAS